MDLELDIFIGTVMPMAFPYTTQGWALCNGMALPIAQHTQLFNLIGYTFGGDPAPGQFCLPDLRGRMLVGAQGAPAAPGVQNVNFAEVGGSNEVMVVGAGSLSMQIGLNNMPQHTHTVTVDSSGFSASSQMYVTVLAEGATRPVQGATLSSAQVTGSGQAAIYEMPLSPGAGMVELSPASVKTTITANIPTGSAGGGVAVDLPLQTSGPLSVMQPYLCLNYMVALWGVFPERPE